MAASVVVVGSCNIDLVAYTPRIPAAGETILGDRFAMGFGGKGANQAVMAARLGAHVAMVGALGDDVYARMTFDNLDRQGVDSTPVAHVPGSSGVAPIWVEPDGTNRIVVVGGANDAVDVFRAAAGGFERLPRGGNTHFGRKGDLVHGPFRQAWAHDVGIEHAFFRHNVTMTDAGRLEDEFVAGFQLRMHTPGVDIRFVRRIMGADVFVIRLDQLDIGYTVRRYIEPGAADRDSCHAPLNFQCCVAVG